MQCNRVVQVVYVSKASLASAEIEAARCTRGSFVSLSQIGRLSHTVVGALASRTVDCYERRAATVRKVSPSRACHPACALWHQSPVSQFQFPISSFQFRLCSLQSLYTGSSKGGRTLGFQGCLCSPRSVRIGCAASSDRVPPPPFFRFRYLRLELTRPHAKRLPHPNTLPPRGVTRRTWLLNDPSVRSTICAMQAVNSALKVSDEHGTPVSTNVVRCSSAANISKSQASRTLCRCIGLLLTNSGLPEKSACSKMLGRAA